MTFLKESMLTTARRHADDEIKGRASAAQVQWLHAHPVLWYRSLRAMWDETHVHITKSHADVVAMRGEQEARGMARPEYLEARARHAKLSQGREHFKAKVKRRMEEVKVLCGPMRMDMALRGDMAVALSDVIVYLDEGDITIARALLASWIRKLGSTEGEEEFDGQ